jgi:hypothetical protein
LNLLVWVAATLTSIEATTMASIGVAALTLLLTISGVVLVTATSAVVLLALVKAALVGGTLASHTGHELLDDVGDLVHVSGVDIGWAIFL